MKKRIVLIVMLCLLLCACGDKKVDEQEKKVSYEITLDKKDVTPGKKIDFDGLPSNYSYSEIPSCAFEGLDKVYTYDDYEITLTNSKDDFIVYSVYLLTPEVKTNEGIMISDGIDKVKEVYGDNYKDEYNELIYNDGKTILSFVYNSENVVASISYTLVTE